MGDRSPKDKAKAKKQHAVHDAHLKAAHDEKQARLHPVEKT